VKAAVQARTLAVEARSHHLSLALLLEGPFHISDRQPGSAPDFPDRALRLATAVCVICPALLGLLAKPARALCSKFGSNVKIWS
jgi:hypothetical protein